MDFEDLLRNRFIQSLGVGTFIYLVLWGLNWAMLFTLRTLETFSRWYRWQASPYILQISIGCAVAYLLWQAAFSSRRN